MSKNKKAQILKDGFIKLPTGKTVKPVNTVQNIIGDEIYFLLNNNKYTAVVDIADYCRFTLWAHRLTLDHGDPTKGVIAYDNGYEHKSLAAMLMNGMGPVRYLNGDRLDCRRENLIAGKIID